ncbi:MAG: sigma-70 family RNA polymerase sigma factor [Defluviicoccus sp.]|nr:MAG: sigma-70 family RNA polymerase sigma factor [Defluviicoccus sp.]
MGEYEGALTNDQLCQLLSAVAITRDRQAFAQLFRYFAPLLKGFGIRRGLEAATAEELVQETMLTVWRKAEMFDPRRATVSTWVFTIIRNKSIDMFRRVRYPETGLDEAAETASDDPSADDQLSASEAGLALRGAMKTLPGEQLKILQKAFFEEKSHQAIADEMKLPLGTVKSRIRLALIRLRTALPAGDA